MILPPREGVAAFSGHKFRQVRDYMERLLLVIIR